MSYCSNCGGRLNDNGLCPNCGGVSESKVKPKQKLDSEVFNCLKTFFTLSPIKAVEGAARTKASSVWVTFGAVFVIANLLTALKLFASLPPQAIGVLMGDNVSQALEAVNQPMFSEAMLSPFTALVTYSVMMSLWFLLILSMMTAILFVLAEERPSVFQSLNITAVSLLSLSFCLLLGSTVSFLSVPVAIALLVIGLAVSAISYYFGVQKASVFKKSPFWLFFILALAANLLTVVVSWGLTMLLFPAVG